MRASALAALSVTLLLGGCDGYGGAGYADEDVPSTLLVTGRYPAPGTLGVSVNTYVEITFNDLIDTLSVESGAIKLNGAALGSVVVNGTKVRYIPVAPLDSGTSYAISIDPQLASKHGHLLGAADTTGFKTSGSTPPPDSLPPLGPRPR